VIGDAKIVVNKNVHYLILQVIQIYPDRVVLQNKSDGWTFSAKVGDTITASISTDSKE